MLVLYDYGAALFLNGRYDEAIAVFDKILTEEITQTVVAIATLSANLNYVAKEKSKETLRHQA